MKLPLNIARHVPVLLFCAAGFWSIGVAAGDLHMDPQLVKGADACGECHKESVAAWKLSHHSTTFKDMPRSEAAADIAKKMGIKRIKSESDCLSCHFTSAVVEEKVRPVAGISCESCHGAGANWIDVHSSFGGKDDTAETETAAHREQRYAASEAAGMIRPTDLYALAANCYSCHTVPNEKLVNVGGHPAGSKFELVRWSQGEVRHNLWYTKDNNEAPLERRRMLYVIGKMIDLEYALRGVAKATQNAGYAKSMAKRAQTAIAWLKKINQTQNISEIDAILADIATVKLRLNNEEQLMAAAAKVAAHAESFADNRDGEALSGIDSLLPTADKYRGAAY